MAEAEGGGNEGRRRKEVRREEEKERRRKEEEKTKEKKTIEIKKIAEEWEIWDNKEEVAKSEKEAKKLVLECFHKWIHMFGKKQSERMPTRKLWDYVIETKKGFVP